MFGYSNYLPVTVGELCVGRVDDDLTKVRTPLSDILLNSPLFS